MQEQGRLYKQDQTMEKQEEEANSKEKESIKQGARTSNKSKMQGQAT